MKILCLVKHKYKFLYGLPLFNCFLVKCERCGKERHFFNRGMNYKEFEQIKSLLNEYKTEQELSDYMQQLGYKLYKPFFLNKDTCKVEVHYTKEGSKHIVKFEAIEDGYFNCLYIEGVSFPLLKEG